MLSPHFKLQEFERSATADAYNICNKAPTSAVSNLQNLCQEVLEPIRNWCGEPIIITSGYRSSKLNTLVGGARNSQHLSGEAADLKIPNWATGRQWQQWIATNTDFDQCILEHSGSRYWLHVSCRRHAPNRHQVLTI